MAAKTKAVAGKKKSAAPAKKVTNATMAKATTKKQSKPVVDAPPLPDPCAKGHKWDKDAEGVEHCTVCLADQKVIEKPVGKKAARVKTMENKLSSLDAAAQVLAGSQAPLNAKQMIERMAEQGLWTSPGGKTPHATLYSAILRGIQVKRKDARFKKTYRGHFTVNT